MAWCLPLISLAWAALPPGRAPFSDQVLTQPVPGAARAITGWRIGKLCDVSKAPYSAANGTNSTALLQQAIDDCGDLKIGGTVLIPPALNLRTGSLWLRSNLTFRVEGTLIGTATGTGDTRASIEDAPMTYTRRNSLMVTAHAGLINGGRCLKMKEAPLGGDDCEKWTKLTNVVIEGGGTLDANGDDWYKVFKTVSNNNLRPMMLDLLWIDGLTIRDMHIMRPGYWTIHPTFSNNVVVVNNSISTWNEFHAGSNTDGVDPDSSWNVYVARNRFSTGDDCISLKAGRDWSGRMVNISTQNVLCEDNDFERGHGVSIGSETSGWVRNVTVRDSRLGGADLAVRIKTERGRGGGVEDILYQNLTGVTRAGIQLTLNYDAGLPPTNQSATPVIRRITLRDISASTSNCTGSSVGQVCALSCEGLADSQIAAVRFDNVHVRGGAVGQRCSDCQIDATNSSPVPRCIQKHRT